MTKKERRRAQLDAVKVLKLTQSGQATLSEALQMAIPMIQSKKTEYTRARRRRAKIEVEKAQRARVYVDEYKKIIDTKKPKRRKMTENEKTRRRARRMLEKQGRGVLTARQKKAIVEGFSAREVVRGWSPIGTKTWKARKTTLERNFEIPDGTNILKINHELEYRTANEVARRHGFERKEQPAADPSPVLWNTFTDVGPILIDWERLVAGYGNRIRSRDIEDNSPGHKSRYVIYENGLFEGSIDFYDIDHKGRFSSLKEARADILAHAMGNDYIYIEYADGVGRVFLTDEWFVVAALAPDWWETGRYSTDPRALDDPDAIDPLTILL